MALALSLVHVENNYVDIAKPIIQINYNIIQCKTKNYISRYLPMDEISIEPLFDIFYTINVDVARMLDKWYNMNKDQEYYEKYKHFLILGMDEEKLNELEDEDIMIKTIKENVFKLNKDPEFYQLFSDEEDNNRLMNSYFLEGEEVGIKKEKISNAKKMKLENIPLNIIEKITGLDMNIIKSL